MFSGGRHALGRDCTALHCTALVANIQKPSPRVLSNEDDHKPSEHPHTLGGCGTLSLSLAMIKFYTYPALGLVFVSVTEHLATFIKYSSVYQLYESVHQLIANIQA